MTQRGCASTDVIEDLLDYGWVTDVGDDAHGAATKWIQANVNVKDSLESLSSC